MTDEFTSHDPVSPVPQPQPQQASLTDRMIAVFTAPSQAMAAVAMKPAIWFPMLLLFALAAISMSASMHISMPQSMEAMGQYMPAEMQGEFGDSIDAYRDPSMGRRIWEGFKNGLNILIGFLLIPGSLLFLFMKLSGGKGKYGQSLAVVFWAGLIAFGLKSLVSWIILVLTESMRFATLNGVVFMSEFNPLSPLAVAAGLLGDPFFYWMLWVIVIGLAKVHGVPRSKAATVVFAMHILLSVIMIGVTLVIQIFMGKLTG